MVSVAIGIVLGVSRYAMYIKSKNSQNREMMNLLEGTLSGITEVLRILGNVNPAKISSEVKRKMEVLIDTLARYIHKRLKMRIFSRQFSLETERFKVKMMMEQLGLLMQEFKIIQIDDLLQRIEMNLNKLVGVLALLEKINQKSTEINENVKFLVKRLGSCNDLCHSFYKLEDRIRKIFFTNGYDGDVNEIKNCLESYFRIERMIKPGLSKDSPFFSKLKISVDQLEKFENVYLINGILKNIIFHQKVIPIVESFMIKENNELKLKLLALESGVREKDFKKGELLEIEGRILRANLKYSYISRSNPIGSFEFDHSKKLFKLTPYKSDIKIYYLVKEKVNLTLNDEFIIQEMITSKHFTVNQYSNSQRNFLSKTNIIKNNCLTEDDEITIDIKSSTMKKKDDFLSIKSDDNQIFNFSFFSVEINQNEILSDLILLENQQFYLRPGRENQFKLIWFKIREDSDDHFYLKTSTVLKIHEKNFQVVYSLDK